MIILQVKIIIFKKLGLNSGDLINFEKYLHFRRVQNQDKIDLINMGEAVMNHNFLDSVDQDKVIGKKFFITKILGVFRLILPELLRM